MLSDRMININVVIGDRPYRLKINAVEESMVREAAKGINQKLREFQQSYNSKDKQDYLAMIALLNTVEGMKNATKEVVSDGPLAEKIDELDQLISQF
jgi:cell division protein ZapA (FtsZ GTPase activity inhibitor)